MADREEQFEAYERTLMVESEYDYDAPIAGVDTIYDRVHRPASANTWTDDFSDEFNLTWMGQLIEGDYEDTQHYNRQYDETYNPFDSDNILGYEQYAEQFQDVRNKDHHEWLKSKIDRNMATRARLDEGGRDILPGLAANLFDPINFVPIPFVRGMGFWKAATRGGTASATLIAATEPIRHSYDPTATTEESVLYVGSGLLFGGVISGAVGAMGKTTASMPALSKKTQKEIMPDGPDKLMNDYLQSHHFADGKLRIYDGISIRYGDFNVELKTVPGKSLPDEPSIKIRVADKDEMAFPISDKQMITDLKDFLPKDADLTLKPNVKIRKGNYVIEIDEGRLRLEYQRMVKDNKFQAPGISSGMRKIIKREEDYINYQKKIALYKYISKPEKGESLVTWEARIHQAVEQETLARQTADYTTSLGQNKLLKWFLSWLDKHTDIGKVVHSYKNIPALGNYISRGILDMTGDHAVMHNFMKDTNIAMNESVHMAVSTTRDLELQKLVTEIDSEFLGFKNGSKEAVTMFNDRVNVTASIAKMQGNLKKPTKPVNQQLDDIHKGLDEVHPDANPWHEFTMTLNRAITDEELFNNKELNPFVKSAATKVRKYLKEYGDDAQELNLFLNGESILKRLKANNIMLGKIDNAMELKSTTRLQKRELNELKKRIMLEKEHIQNDSSQLANGRNVFRQGDDYLPIYYNREAIFAHEAQFKNFLKTKFMQSKEYEKMVEVAAKQEKKAKFLSEYKAYSRQNPKTRMPYHKWLTRRKKLKINDKDIIDPEVMLDKRIEQIYDNIMWKSAHMDSDNVLALAPTTKSEWQAGVSGLMRQELDIKYKEWLDPKALTPDGIAFVETDTISMLKTYKSRMAPAIEITKRFGDRHANDWQNQLRFDVIMDTVKTEKDVTNMRSVLKAFRDSKDKLYGVYNTLDPTGLNKQSAGFIKNWTSLAVMGKVVATALADTGRVVMVHGMARILPHIQMKFTNPQAYIKMMEEFKNLFPYTELTGNMGAMERMFGAGFGVNPYTNTTFGKYLANPAQKVQGAWYWMNGLTPWTMFMKRWTGMISQSRFIEDSIKWDKGLLDPAGQARMKSYGINKEVAKTIARMPYEQWEGKFIPNSHMWVNQKGGRDALRIYRNAIKGDVERIVVTPSPNDKINMMYGSVEIDSQTAVEFFDNPVGRYFGFTKTDMGGKFQNAFMSIPLQFYSWMIAANRRLLMSGVAGRDFYLLSGAAAMVSFAIMGDMLKNPEWWYRKSLEEKILTGVEKSGVLAIFSDIPNILETISGNEYGVRPMLGMPDPYGFRDQDHEQFRPVLGAAGSNIADIYHAFSDGTWNDRSDAIRRMTPLNNHILWHRMFKNAWTGTFNE